MMCYLLIDSEWWEMAIEMVPVAGDAYGATKFGKRIAAAYSKMQEIENKYVEKIYNSLPSSEKERFKKNMRKAGVRDAKRDQNSGIFNGEQFIGDGKVDGHHIESVLDNPARMTDPSNIRMMKKEDHKALHSGDLILPELEKVILFLKSRLFLKE